MKKIIKKINPIIIRFYRKSTKWNLILRPELEEIIIGCYANVR
jgi:hypothetical protein